MPTSVKWIPYRGVNGEYGWLNLKTNKFQTNKPDELSKQRKAALVTHSAKQAKYERTDAKRRNHSDETVKKSVSVPIMTMNPDGTFTNNYVQQMAPSESSLSTHDPIAEFYIGTKALNPVFNLLGKGYTYGMARIGDNYARGKIISNELNKSLQNLNSPVIPLNIGWGPKQTFKVSHASNDGNMQTFFPKRWDVLNEGANPHGIWFQGKLGTPRTDITNPGKGIKAARARALFANRPVQIQGNLTLEKPMITVGDVPNRSWLSYYADKAGADGLIYNGVYDNGYNNNQVILSFKKLAPNVTSEIGNNFNQSFPKFSNSLNLHFQRLKNGGYDKLEKQYREYISNNPTSSGILHFKQDDVLGEVPFIRKNLRNKVSIVTPTNKNSILSEQDLRNAGGALAFTSQGMIEFSPKVLIDNGYDISRALSHELDHALHIPIEKARGFDFSKLSIGDQLYFTKQRNTELSARGSQIKDWLGFNKSNQNITEYDLKNAAQNYIKETGMNNKMSQFFNSISDYKQAAEWLSKYSTILSVPIILNKNE